MCVGEETDLADVEEQALEVVVLLLSDCEETSSCVRSSSGDLLIHRERIWDLVRTSPQYGRECATNHWRS